jgi:hypothetical protein
MWIVSHDLIIDRVDGVYPGSTVVGPASTSRAGPVRVRSLPRPVEARVVVVAVDLGSAGDDGLEVQHDHAFRGQFVQCAPHGGVFSLVLQTKSVQVGQYLPAGELAGGDAAA